MGLRKHFDEELNEIRSDVLRMGSIVSEMARTAVDATLQGELEHTQKVMQMDDEVDRLEQEIMSKCVLVVMKEAPVASDLKMLASFLSVVGELEKGGDDMVKLARRATKLTGHFPAEMKLALKEMGEAVGKQFAAAVKLCSEYDDGFADEVIKADKQIDGQYVSARDRLIAIIQENPTATEHLVRSIEAFHALEHLADHAVEIAKRLKVHFGPPA